MGSAGGGARLPMGKGFTTFVIAALVVFAWAREPARTAVSATHDFDAAQIARGAELAALGNCLGCHTADGGAAFAGGHAIDAKLGVVYSTNITPDPETGIGQWTLADFRHAMREGIRPDGVHLYPAFPYPYFTKLSDTDIAALYAFQMTRAPVRATAPPNQLPYPFNQRPLIALWNLAYLQRGAQVDLPNADAAWNRGAYLVEALAHCGACHTSSNKLGAADPRRPFDGGEVDGWHAPALNQHAPSPVPWTEATLFDYLRLGWAEQHSAALGPMKSVIAGTARVADAEIAAIARYVATMMGSSPPGQGARAIAQAEREARAAPELLPAALQSQDPGAATFAGACRDCHTGIGPQPFAGGINLALSTAVHASSPDTLIQVILRGVQPQPGDAGFLMPPFAQALDDAQIADLVVHIRARYSAAAPWSDVRARVAQLRAKGDKP